MCFFGGHDALRIATRKDETNIFFVSLKALPYKGYKMCYLGVKIGWFIISAPNIVVLTTRINHALRIYIYMGMLYRFE